MSENRTHEATQRKLARATERGDFPQSAELGSALMLAAALGGYLVAGPQVVQALRELFAVSFLAARRPADADLFRTFAPPLARLAQALAPCLFALVAAALFGTLLQAGFRLGPSRLRPELARLDPFAAARDRFSLARLGDVALTLGKLLVVAGLVLALAWQSMRGMLDAWQRSPAAVLGLTSELTHALLSRALLAFVLVGALDYLYQRWRFRLRLRMSRRELLQERRESEGDPLMLRERRRRQQQAHAEATLAELGRATLVIHGPADRAVALRFDAAKGAVPVLWLKAERELAERLVKKALVAGLPVHEDADLATQLHRLELTEPVPEAFYDRVAELMVARAESKRPHTQEAS